MKATIGVFLELKYAQMADERRINYFETTRAKKLKIAEPQHFSLRSFLGEVSSHTASIHTIKRNSSDSLEISISMDLNGHAWIQTFGQSVLNRHITAAATTTKNNNLVPNPKSEKHFPGKSLAPHGYCAKVKYKL